MNRLVTVVIPVKNNSRYLGEAIGSVLQQSYPDVEVIVVDNGSTDDSRSVAESFGSKVRLIEEAEAGAAHARNAGVRIAQGQYLAFLDADDLWAQGKLARQVDELDVRRDLDMVFTHGENFPSPELTEAQQRAVTFLPEAGPFIMPSSMLARRQSFLKAGPLPALQEGEFIAWYGVALSKGLQSFVIPDVLIRRRIHLTNSTRAQRRPGDLLRAAKMVLDQKKRVS